MRLRSFGAGWALLLVASVLLCVLNGHAAAAPAPFSSTIVRSPYYLDPTSASNCGSGAGEREPPAVHHLRRPAAGWRQPRRWANSFPAALVHALQICGVVQCLEDESNLERWWEAEGRSEYLSTLDETLAAAQGLAVHDARRHQLMVPARSARMASNAIRGPPLAGATP